MIPELSSTQRIHLLRRAQELGLLEPGDLEMNLDPAAPTLSESDLRDRFDRLVKSGRISPSFIESELQQVNALPTTQGEDPYNSLDRLALLREADPSHPEMMNAFPLPKGGRYVPLAYLGDGGMGRVYKAFDLQLKRVVALKFLKRLEKETLDRFLQEGRAQAQIDHPHVANVYSVGQVDGHPYLAMRFIDGPTLRAALPVLNLQQKVRIIKAAAEALHACHRMGIVHRDVKPTNIMLERTENGDWWPFIMDFGLAREMDSESQTVTGVIVGTPVYCSPEQVQGHVSEVDRRSDVYSLGATLYEALCGEPPFPAQGSLVDLVRRIVEEDPPSLIRRVPNLPQDLETLCMKALSKEATRRYDSARAFAEDLGRFLDGDPIQARTTSLAYRLLKRLQKNRILAVVVLVATLIIATLAAFGISMALRSRITAQSAQRFGREAEQIEIALFRAYVLPLHDTRPTRRMVEARLQSLRAELSREGRWSQAAGHLALGRGYLALGHLEAARKALETARRLAPKDPETAMSLGTVLARLYQDELSGLRGKARDDRKRDLEASLHRPALDCLRQGQEVSPERAAFGSALLALVEERIPEAASQARLAATLAPWNHEAYILLGDIHRAEAAASLAHGNFEAAEAALVVAEDDVRQAQTIARSAPAAYRAELELKLMRFQLLMDRGRATEKDRDAAMAAATRALEADPEDVQTLGYQAAIHRRWAHQLLRLNQNPSQDLARAVEISERGLRYRPDDGPLLNNLASALRNLAEWQVGQGENPQPTLTRAVEVLQKGLTLGRFQDWFYNNLGICKSVLGDWKAAHGQDPLVDYRESQLAFQKAMSIRPWVGHASSQGVTELVWAAFLEQSGADPLPMLRSALASFQAGLALNPGSYQCHTGAAMTLAELARHHEPSATAKQIREHVDRTLSLNPNQGLDPWLVRIQVAQLDPRDPKDLTHALAQAQQKIQSGEDRLQWAETLLDIQGLPDQRPRLSQLLPSLPRTTRDGSRVAWLEARVLARLGKKEEARRRAAEALALNGNLKAAVIREGLQ